MLTVKSSAAKSGKPRKPRAVCGRQNGSLSSTTMPPPRLPPELLDYIVDQLYETRDTLKSCCLVSKSWIHRTRNHLFADVGFRTVGDLQAWKNAFPDPSISPARYTTNLTMRCPGVVTAADAEERGWIPAFSHVVHLNMNFCLPETSLLPFHGFSPALKFFRAEYGSVPLSRIVNLIHAFPIFEDLSLFAWDDDTIEDIDEQPTVDQRQPPLTGTLQLDAREKMGHTISQLFPERPPFPETGFEVESWKRNFEIAALVKRWRYTFESLWVCVGCCGTFVRPLCSDRWLILQMRYHQVRLTSRKRLDSGTRCSIGSGLLNGWLRRSEQSRTTTEICSKSRSRRTGTQAALPILWVR